MLCTCNKFQSNAEFHCRQEPFVVFVGSFPYLVWAKRRWERREEKNMHALPQRECWLGWMIYWRRPWLHLWVQYLYYRYLLWWRDPDRLGVHGYPVDFPIELKSKPKMRFWVSKAGPMFIYKPQGSRKGAYLMSLLDRYCAWPNLVHRMV